MRRYLSQLPFTGWLLPAALVFLPGQAVAQPQAPKTGCQAHLERWRQLSVIPLPEWRWKEVSDAEASGRGEAVDLDDSNWEAAAPRKEWTATSVWLRRRIELPAAFGGYRLQGARLELRIRIGSDYPVYQSVFVDGLSRAQGYEFEPVILTENAQPGQKFVVAVKARAPAGKLRLGQSQMELIAVHGRPDARQFFEECASAEIINESLGGEGAASGAPTEAGKEERAAQLMEAVSAVEWGALERGDQAAFDKSLERARAKIEPLRDWLRSYSIRGVGNAHIDMAWLWPWTETVEVTRNTFSSVLQLMQEFPDLHFTHASVQTYTWMEDKYPELFEEVRRRVREGRWEIVGGMWVEPDLNLPDGESLVRQLLVGKRYVQQKFGRDVRIGWNPDSFGYNWQLPQIYKRSGLDFFITQKIAWNDTTKFPLKLFWWEAPDGSRVLTYFPHDYVNSIEPIRLARDVADYSAATRLPQLLHLYGIGDHGGGPTRRMLESARKWQAPGAVYPQLRLGTAQSFFDEIQPRVASLDVPVWKNELYLEYHRGTYTTQAQTKKNNRRNETLLLNAEKFSSLGSLFGQPYRKDDFQSAWRKVLFNQFHDILPGSGIAVVYRDASRDHAEVGRLGRELLTGALDTLTARIRTAGPGTPVVVFNALAWPRTDVVEAEVRVADAGKNYEVVDPLGKPTVAEVINQDVPGHRITVRFLAQDIPSLGYKVFHVVAAKAASKTTSALHARGTELDNEFLRVRVDAKTGCITSLWDKRQNREVLAAGACGNLLQAFRDKPKDWDAWNIDSNFEDEKWDLTTAEEVKLVDDSPTRAVLRVRKSFQKSRFVQDITLYPGVPRVDVRMEADWREEHILLKVAFPLDARSDVATFEIPFGSISRPTTRRTPEEKAKFEVPALRWADLSDARGGLSVLNDCKYGHDAKDNVLRLSLLRSPKWPDPDADQGHHELTYSLYPHAGTWQEAGTVRRGYELNNRLIAMSTDAHSGDLPASHSFVGVEPANVVLTAIKKAEDDDSLLFRFYEFAGRETQVLLRLPVGASRAVETNLMEKEEQALVLKDGIATVPTRPYEIKTLKVFFSPAGK